MSGGSYEYLEFKDLNPYNYLLKSMSERLRSLGVNDAADQTAAIAAAEKLATPELKRLWHAVEWHDSNDWGKEQLLDAIRDWTLGA